MAYIDDITEKAILFDSIVSDKSNENSLMYHTMYAYTEVFGYPALLKLQVEELFYHNKDASGILNRDYILQNIEEESISRRNRFSRPNRAGENSSNMSIADLYDLVKQYDKSFELKTPSKISNKDGSPKIVYHGTDKSFTTFKAHDGNYWFSELYDYAESMMEERGGGEVMGVYLNMRKPYSFHCGKRRSDGHPGPQGYYKRY